MNIFFVLCSSDKQACAEYQWRPLAEAHAAKEANRLGLTHWVCEVVFTAHPEEPYKGH
jgi:hypothetical protein